MTASVLEIRERVKELLAEMDGGMQPDDIPDDWPLFEAPLHGMEIDSLDSLKLAIALTDEYDLDSDIELDYSRLKTVTEIAEFVQRLMPRGGGL